MYFKNILYSSIFIFISAIILQQSLLAKPLILSNNGKTYIGNYLQYIEDKNNKWKIAEITSSKLSKKFKQCVENIPNFGYTKSTYWIRFTISTRKQTEVEKEWILELPYPLLDSVQLYIPTSNNNFKIITTGDSLPFKSRKNKHQNFLFKIKTVSNTSKTYYLRIKSESSIEVPLKISNTIDFTNNSINYQIGFGIFIGIILLLIFYSFFVLIALKDLNYLYYIFYIIGYTLFQTSIYGHAFKYLWENNPWWANRSVSFFIGFTILLLLIFTKSFLNIKKSAPLLNRIFIVFIFISFTIMGLSLSIPYKVSIQIGALFSIIVAATVFITGIMKFIKGVRMVRFFLIAFATFLAEVIIFALKNFGVLSFTFFPNIIIQIGFAMQIIFLFFALGDRINIINREKKDEQFKKIEAQEKYKILIEGTKDIIFILNEKMNIISVNNAIRHHFLIGPGTIISKNFLDLIYVHNNETSITKKLINEKIKQFKKNREPVNFIAEYKSINTIEPKKMQVNLEYINIEGIDEILGKASRIEKDSLIEFLQFEMQEFSIQNLIYTADEVSHRISSNLTRFIGKKEVTLIRTAVREIIINAIEHGNLNISFQEKTDAIQNHSYIQLINERRYDPLYAHKKVKIKYSVDENSVEYTITDEGNGFDYNKYIYGNAMDVNINKIPHGRGILMTKKIFDEIKYNKTGNEVVLIKRFK